MRKIIGFLGGCCVTLFFVVTYMIMRGINYFKERKGDDLVKIRQKSHCERK